MRKAGIRSLLYTSPSYVPAIKERWRILVPLSQNHPPETREKLVARINGLFGGKIAPESFTLSQAYLFGHVDNPDHRVEVIDGDFLDLRDELFAGSIFRDGSRTGDQAANGSSIGSGQQRRHKSRKDDEPGPVDLAKIKAALETIDSGPYETWLHVGAALYRELGEYGFEIFNAWSAKSPKYQPGECKEKWRDIRDFTEFTAGTIFYLADQADRGWRDRYDEEVRRCWHDRLRDADRASAGSDAAGASGGASSGDADALVLDPGDPMPSARAIVREMFTGEEGRTLHRHRSTFWRYDGSCYRIVTDETIDGEIWRFLDRAKQQTQKGPTRFKPSRNKVGDVRSALAAACLIDDQIEPPAWLTRDGDDVPPAGELFACGNGLLHVPSGKLYPPTPDYFGVAASGVHFDPDAWEPRQWYAYLEQVLGNAEAIAALREWMGYMLTPDTSQQKILLGVGPRRSGKGTLARVLTALLGKLSVAGPTMSQLGDTFGLEPLITKPLAIVSDARIGGRTDKSVIVERLLSISGEDTMTVSRKHVSSWTGRLPTRFMIMTNELPALTEGSGALAGRLVVLVFPRSFYGKEDVGLTEKLLAELPGILNWSIEGYRRLRERGHFVQPRNALEKLDQIEMLAAPVKAFLRDRCEIGPGFEVGIDELFNDWKIWNEDNGSARGSGSKEWFGRNLSSAVPGVVTARRRGDGKRSAVYVGLRLTPH